MSHYVYIIRCVDDYLYTGITYNIEKRFNEHKSGQCRNTVNRLPIELVHVEKFISIIEAAKREKEIKGWRREKKEKLIRN